MIAKLYLGPWMLDDDRLILIAFWLSDFQVQMLDCTMANHDIYYWETKESRKFVSLLIEQGVDYAAAA